MTEEQIRRKIDDFIKKTKRLLPDNFETEDLLEDLRGHIDDSLADKRAEKPDVDPLILLNEVLMDVGTAEDIADEYKSEQSIEPSGKRNADRWIGYIMRLTAAVLVAVLAAWIVSAVVPIDFTSAVIVLVAFAFIEWWIRGKQTAPPQ
jgi:uncharacterized membrane protein